MIKHRQVIGNTPQGIGIVSEYQEISPGGRTKAEKQALRRAEEYVAELVDLDILIDGCQPQSVSHLIELGLTEDEAFALFTLENHYNVGAPDPIQATAEIHDISVTKVDRLVVSGLKKIAQQEVKVDKHSR